MEATNLWKYPGEIGGPMEKGQEYRRNVNVLTYGFDQSFLDYFGTPGVLAVQQAFATLNRLPSATSINVNRYPTNSVQFNEGAQQAVILDLKLVTLHTLLEEMGLTSPLRYVWTLHYMDQAFLDNPFIGDESTMSANQIALYMRQLSFDPATFQPSRSINGNAYTLGFSFCWATQDHRMQCQFQLTRPDLSSLLLQRQTSLAMESSPQG